MVRIKELLPLILMAIFGIIIILIIPYQIKQSTPALIGPRFIPYLAATSIVLCSLASLIYSFIKKKNIREREDKKTNKIGYFRVILIFICIVVWIYFLPIMGFIITTLVTTVLTCLIFGGRNVYTIALISVLFSFGIYYTFSNVLKISLPSGILF